MARASDPTNPSVRRRGLYLVPAPGARVPSPQHTKESWELCRDPDQYHNACLRPCVRGHYEGGGAFEEDYRRRGTPANSHPFGHVVVSFTEFMRDCREKR
jgi:hypothetical protein